MKDKNYQLSTITNNTFLPPLNYENSKPYFCNLGIS